MAWDATLPGNAEKIRSLGTVIRPNWEAIEQGDDVGVATMLEMRSVQLDNRTGLAANNDPQTNAGTHYLYSKDDGGGVQEAFTKDSAGNIIQLTNGGKIGETAVDYEAESISYDGTITFNERNMVVAWGLVLNASLTVVPSYGIATVTRPGAAGIYKITFNANIVNNANYVVTATSVGLNSVCIVDSGTPPTAALFRIRRRTPGGALANGDFMFMVVGGQ